MAHFGMKLHAVIAAFRVTHGCDRAVARPGQGNKTGWRGLDAVAVAHPHRVAARREEQVLADGFDGRRPIFAVRRRGNPPTQGMGQGLHAVADTQHRQSAFQQVGQHIRRAGSINRVWPAGKNEAFRVKGQDFFRRSIPGKKLAVYMRFAHAAGDQLAVLRTKIENRD